MDNLSGLSNLDTVVFYRDKSIKAPHNAFTSYDGIQAGMEKKGYRTELREGIDNHFSFHLEDTEQTGGKPAEKVTLGFSSYTSPYFVYDSSRKEYKRYQFQKEHIDKTTGEVLTFKNLIIQFVKEWDIDKNGYQTMELGNTSGKGYYITDGTYTEITWKKNESTKKMNYYDGNGDRLVINPGKTYIGVFPEKRSDKLVISEHE